MTPAVASAGGSTERLPALPLFAYGLFGMPLAMAALPLYVHLPKYYGDHLGVSLGVLGGLLLALRLADAAIDPLLGAWSDRGPTRKVLIGVATPVLALGMVALFFAGVITGSEGPSLAGDGPRHVASVGVVAWLGVALALVYLAFSLATINHNAWGAELSADPVERTRITAAREGLALAGVVIASVAPGLLGGSGGEVAGLPRFALAFALFAIACATVTLALAPAAPRANVPVDGSLVAGLRDVLADPTFRRLLAVFVLNGIASAIPATLILFFVADVLQAEGRQGLFLALYFVAGAAGMPLWVRLSARVGKVRAWHIGMLLAVIAFVGAARLSAGDIAAFAVICVLSGLALGSDLALPPSLLADVIGRGGRPHATGAYFGLWTLATKLNLALAAGIGLPLIAALGYAPGAREPAALSALALAYAAVPCALKLGAAAALYWFDRRWQRT